MAHKVTSRNYSLQLQETVEALRRLCNFNNLARVYLHQLGVDDS